MLSRTNVYVGGGKYFDELNKHVITNSTKPIVVTGPPGSGKVRRFDEALDCRTEIS
jgi:hypothetical protein